HSHALSAVLAADATDWCLTLRRFEMLKGIRGVSNRDEHLVPVIENTENEADLVGQVAQALATDMFGAAFAILVRDHGAYIWGFDVWEAKKHAEVYHWLFAASWARQG
ncbi:MAG: class II aldolase/adducin family protein, partial [Candidatus Limnocylindrales bacterium]